MHWCKISYSWKFSIPALCSGSTCIVSTKCHTPSTSTQISSPGSQWSFAILHLPSIKLSWYHSYQRYPPCVLCPRVHRIFEPPHLSLILCHIPKSFWSLNGHTSGFSLVYLTHWCNTYSLGNRPQQIDLFLPAEKLHGLRFVKTLSRPSGFRTI